MRQALSNAFQDCSDLGESSEDHSSQQDSEDETTS